jgi:hypothetical protein
MVILLRCKGSIYKQFSSSRMPSEVFDEAKSSHTIICNRIDWTAPTARPAPVCLTTPGWRYAGTSRNASAGWRLCLGAQGRDSGMGRLQAPHRVNRTWSNPGFSTMKRPLAATARPTQRGDMTTPGLISSVPRSRCQAGHDRLSLGGITLRYGDTLGYYGRRHTDCAKSWRAADLTDLRHSGSTLLLAVRCHVAAQDTRTAHVSPSGGSCNRSRRVRGDSRTCQVELACGPSKRRIANISGAEHDQ